MNTTDKSLYEITGDIKDINTLLVGRAEIEALVRDAEELAFLKNDLLSWVDHAVEKGNANSDIQEESERYDQWLKTRHAAMQENNHD